MDKHALHNLLKLRSQ